MTNLVPKLSDIPSLPDIELVAAEFHRAWISALRTQGISSCTTGARLLFTSGFRPAHYAEEQLRPYAQLSPQGKDVTRNIIRDVYAAIQGCSANGDNGGIPK